MSKILSKIVAVILVLAMTAINVIAIASYFTNVAIAIAENGELETQSTKTNHENVEFDVYFKENDGNSHTGVFPVDDDNAKLNVLLNVKKEEGYLKNAKISLKDANYELRSNVDISNSQIMQEIDENTVSYKQINGGNETVIYVGIRKKEVDMALFDETGRESSIVFTGTYVDKKGNEVAIEKEIKLFVGWTDENEISIQEELQKYIASNDQILMQNKIEIERTKGRLPIEYTELEVDAIKIGQILPEEKRSGRCKS